MNIDQLKDAITNYLKILYECKYNFNIYKTLKMNNETINSYFYPFVIILDSLIANCIIRLNSIISSKENKSIKKLMENCKNNKKYIANENLDQILNKLDELLENNEELVKKITTLRDKNLAHSDSKYFGKTEKIFEDNELINEKLIHFIEGLITNIKEISILYETNSIYDYSKEIDLDLENLLDVIKKDLNK